MKVCPACVRGLHQSCKSLLLGNPKMCECSHSTSESPASIHPDGDDVPSLFSTDPPDEVITVKSRRSKPDAALKDQQSTGRKRAAKLYPLDREADCEWAGKPNSGGGVGIDGCGLRVNSSGILVGVGKQEARHHGPDYNTLNNDPGNVHRICNRCHNSWHSVNDPVKGEGYLKLYGVKPKAENLSQAAKELRSGGPSEK